MLQARFHCPGSASRPLRPVRERWSSARTGALSSRRHIEPSVAPLQQWQPLGQGDKTSCRRRRASRRIVVARAASPEPVVAVDGDLVTLHYDCTDVDGEMVDSSRARDEPLTLELGVSEIVSNPLLSAMEQAVRSHGVGDIIQLSLKGKEYDPELVFTVPCDHPEIIRLSGRYKSQGGLVEDKIVELQNSQWAKVVKVTESEVVLDANPMLAGLQRRLTIEVLGIERPAVPAAEG